MREEEREQWQDVNATMMSDEVSMLKCTPYTMFSLKFYTRKV